MTDVVVSMSIYVIFFTFHHCLGHDWVSEEDMDILKAVNTWIETTPTGVDYVSTANQVDLSDGDYLNVIYEQDPPDGLHPNAVGELVVKQNMINAINVYWGQ